MEQNSVRDILSRLNSTSYVSAKDLARSSTPHILNLAIPSLVIRFLFPFDINYAKNQDQPSDSFHNRVLRFANSCQLQASLMRCALIKCHRFGLTLAESVKAKLFESSFIWNLLGPNFNGMPSPVNLLHEQLGTTYSRLITKKATCYLCCIDTKCWCGHRITQLE